MDLTNVPLPTLQGWSQQALNAQAALASGARIASANYAQGDGSRGVTYSTADLDQLRAWVANLQREIALRTGATYRSRRRAIGIRF